ncbi:type II toxin-antitoxin system CcdA family antitoxin [Rahnella aquatilis]|uniref:Post-segregation antitoxin (Ccd killing mechanism protein) encoded by the F plasmid n=2 Tax=Rahnella aquatilis TaxID=34038 RepID=H2IXW0_RAHAC|nr:type II toxin-antitoxin system CcdA family antitoxin [Rahnella aquatilis]AEX51985.1 post-segregation antitoxin (ccd killing mechanism protein) encoded by the F plasmid [Rahnella aquatilis CIP 78.65 = ATCC 33071]
MASLCDTLMRMSCVYKEGVMLSIAGNKKRTNVTLSADLLEQAKAFGINLSATFDKALGEAVKEKQRTLFLEENQQAMDSCNAFTEKAGLFSQGRGVL